MREPQELQDEEYEQVVGRVAAVDVAEASGMVCTRVPHPSRPGRRVTKVWEVDATTNAITELADHLVRQGIEKVTVESTSDYWRPFLYLLQAAGLSVQLVNARDVKNVPGRPKTDRLDAVWLAKLTERGMLRPSFVPPAEIRQLRDYTRLRVDLTHERARYWQRLEKLLEDALIKVSSVASTLDTLSVRDMLEALIAGERDPRVLAGLARGLMRRSARSPPASRNCFRRSPPPRAWTPTAPPAQAPAPAPTRRCCRPPPAWMRSPASAQAPRRSSSPSSGWTWASSPPPPTWCRGPSCAHAPSSPAPSTAPAPPARATPTSKASSARPPPRPPRPTPSSASATGAWSSAAASARPWSPSPAPSW